MGWFRSKEMKYISITCHQSLVEKVVRILGNVHGDTGVFQFLDSNQSLTAVQRSAKHTLFAHALTQIRRCDDMERIIRYLSSEMRRVDEGLSKTLTDPIDADQERYLNEHVDAVLEDETGAAFENLYVETQQLEARLRQLAANMTDLTQQHNGAVQRRQVLVAGRAFYVEGGVSEASENLLGGSEPKRGMGGSGRRGGGGGGMSKDDPEAELNMLVRTEDDVRFDTVAGVIKTSLVEPFRRQLFRSTRGNCYVQFKQIPKSVGLRDPDTQAEVDMSVYVVFYRTPKVRGRIVKVAEAFAAFIVEIPPINDRDLFVTQMNQVDQEIEDIGSTMEHTRADQARVLASGVAPHVRKWLAVAQRRKAIFHTVTKFRPTTESPVSVGMGLAHGSNNAASQSVLLVSEGWMLAEGADDIIQQLRAASVDGPQIIVMAAEPPPGHSPPTYFETNKFTRVFQGMVDTYGVGRYQEANPALFTAITFPFLFGVMYGDIGHGFCVFMFGLLMVLYEKNLGKRRLGDIGEMVFAGRYMILLMGLFAVYMGFIYNDLFSLTLPTFGSTWKTYYLCNHTNTKQGRACSQAEAIEEYGNEVTQLPTFPHMESVQPFGLDPIWHNAGNALPFQNSMKMKFSVILGITQMIFGVLLKTSNAIYFRKPLDFFFECIPMLVFAFCFFGYMVFLIFKKWSVDWNNGADGMPGHYTPPALINTLINMALSPGKVKDPLYGRVHVATNGSFPVDMLCGGDPTITCCTENGCKQAIVQWWCLILAGLSVPVILCCKPCILWRMAKAKQAEKERQDSMSNRFEMGQRNAEGNGHDELDDMVSHHGDDHGGGSHGEDIGDLMIHQTIETIEFVLGFVSNTASYLRLWALSLAHAELAEVFWGKTMGMVINGTGAMNFIFVFCAFAVWMVITVAVLLMMDVLECFLHALRLHWVEFMNKFYYADGYAFEPFHLRKLKGHMAE